VALTKPVLYSDWKALFTRTGSKIYTVLTNILTGKDLYNKRGDKYEKKTLKNTAV